MSLSPGRRPRSLRRVLAAIAAFVLVALTAAWYVHSRGGWYVHARGGGGNVLQRPPLVDPSTPRSQFGYTLTDVRRADVQANDDSSDRAVTYLFVRPPTFPKCQQGGQDDVGDYSYDPPQGTTPLVQATAQTSNGDVAPLSWKIVGNADGPQFLRLEIPGGYSDDCRSLDVTLVPNSGPFPRWRITRLPAMRHVIPDEPQITDHITTGGTNVTALAWRSRHNVFLQVRPNLPPASHQWELVMNEQWSEWEKFGQPTSQEVFVPNPILGRSGVFPSKEKSPSGNLTARFSAPYRSASHYVRLACSLRQFETYDEPVTFHNVAVRRNKDDNFPDAQAYYLSVPSPITVTTPSRIAVSLPVQGQEAPTSMYGLTCLVATYPEIQPEGGSHTILVSDTLKVQQEEDRTFDLPHSPLTQAFGKPVQLRLVVPPPYTLGPWIDGAEVGQLGLDLDLPWKPTHGWQRTTPNGIPLVPPPPVLKNFTVIVRQRVDIQTIPMTFTVPVSDTPPPDVK